MKKSMMTDEEFVEYFENHDFGDEMYEAYKKGDLIVTMPGESAIEAAKCHRTEKAQKAKPATIFARPTTRRHVAAMAAV